MTVALLLLVISGCTPPGAQDADVDPVVVGKTLHRLNRAEYDNTVRDLLDVTFAPSSLLPPDEVTFGFDNVAQALTTSSSHLEGYEVGADRVLDEMMGRFEEETIDYPSVPADDPTVTYAGDGRLFAFGYVIYSGDLTGTISIDYDGVHRIEGTVFGRRDEGPPLLGLFVDGQPVEEFDASFEPNEPGTVSTEVFLDAGFHRVTWRLMNPVEQKGALTQGAGLESFQITGPLDPVNGRTAAYDRLVPCDSEDAACAERAITNFLTEAWRRPAAADDIAWARGVYDLGIQQGEPWDRALQHAFKAVLLHPSFAYRVEGDPVDGEPARALNGFEVANRLSYFLWSSMPDAALFEAAADGRLEASEGVIAQTDRMLADDKAGALVDNLVGQWWGLRNLKDLRPQEEAYPEFDEALRASMEQELAYLAEDFFADRASLRDVLLRQESWIDARLAEHYGVSWPEDDEGWALTAVPDGRTGLLGAAAWLALTSNPTRPSAVRRGKWVLDSLLCSPPPPPPPEVEDQAEPEPGEGSVREQEEAGRADAFCQRCHGVMDPVGFAIGNFDGIGGHRTEDSLGYAIDAQSTFGEVEIGSVADVARWVVDNPDLPRCVVERAFTYAMGRPPEPADEPHIESIVDQFVMGELTFGALTHALVSSRPFRFRSAPLAGAGEAR